MALLYRVSRLYVSESVGLGLDGMMADNIWGRRR